MTAYSTIMGSIVVVALTVLIFDCVIGVDPMQTFINVVALLTFAAAVIRLIVFLVKKAA